MTIQEVTDERQSLTSIIGRIAMLLDGHGGLSAGDRAALRRMDPRHPAAAFFKLEGLVLDPILDGDATSRAEQETRWAAIVVGLAWLGRLHDSSRRFGLVLADAQFSELRFARLLRADGDRLVDELPTLARFLAAKGLAVDWTPAARLILSAGHPREEETRRHIARDYYGALARQESR